MNIVVPSLPKRVQIPQAMIEELVWNPVLAAKWLLGMELDEFQKVRLKIFWFVPVTMDESGYSSAKTIVDWIYIQLRCLLNREHDAGVYYPVFETGKNTFWRYYSRCKSPIFHAHIGQIEMTEEESPGEGRRRRARRTKGGKIQGAGCYKVFYKNGSTMLMPAPSFMKHAATQASMRYSTVLIEEWTHIDAMSQGIDEQLIGRATKATWNQEHPVWTNHLKFTAPAKPMSHPSFERFRTYQKLEQSGDPNVAVISFCYKDYSNRMTPEGRTYRELYRNDRNIQLQKAKLAYADFLGECLGIRSRSGKGWFTEAAVANCVERGRVRGVVPVVSK